MATSGDCYADGLNTSRTVSLWYYAGCTGTGIELTSANGFLNTSPGGLDIDINHNLVSIDYKVNGGGTSQVWVYSGCSTLSCTLVGGPLPLTNGQAEFGHLNRLSTRFVTANFQYGQIDIYKYTTTPTLTYKFSFNNHLAIGLDVLGAAYKPASSQ